LFEHGKAALIPLEKSSFPVGLFAEATYFDTTRQLTEDFALVLFSDGILEFLKLPDMTAKENHLCRVIEESQGDFDRMKDQLGLNKHVSVPDDIAVMSVTRA
jgi:serine phosphatase RsbU (regulator of sigma subunit)